MLDDGIPPPPVGRGGGGGGAGSMYMYLCVSYCLVPALFKRVFLGEEGKKHELNKTHRNPTRILVETKKTKGSYTNPSIFLIGCHLSWPLLAITAFKISHQNHQSFWQMSLPITLFFHPTSLSAHPQQPTCHMGGTKGKHW